MSIPPPASQQSFSDRVFEEQRRQALLGDAEPALVRARVLLAVVVVAAAIAPVIEGLRWYGELKVPTDPDMIAGPSAWPLLLVAIAAGVALLYRARGGRSPRGLVGVALAVGAAVDLCAASVLLEDQELFTLYALPVPSVLVFDLGVPVAIVWGVVAAVISWKSNERGPGPLVVAAFSIVLIGAAVFAVVVPAFVFGGSIN